MFAAVQGYYYYKAHVIRLKNLAAFSGTFATLRPAPGSTDLSREEPFPSTSGTWPASLCYYVVMS